MLGVCKALVERLLGMRQFDTALRSYLAADSQANEGAYREMVSRLPAPPDGASLLDRYPEVAAQWDVAANVPLTPDLFSPGSGQRVGWVCAAGHRWQATIKNRTKNGSGCPECDRAKAPERKRRLLARKFGTLEDASPDFLAMWDREANGDLAPSALAQNSGHRVSWRCRYGHAFVKTPAQMKNNASCPICRSLTSLYPAIAAEWDRERNTEISPDDVTPGSSRRVWWRCAAGHRWQAVIAMRASGTDCPICFEQRRCGDHLAAAARRTRHTLTGYAPAWLSDWESGLNGSANPDEIASNSDVLYWWRCGKGHLFQRSPCQRSHNSRRPGCAKAERAEAVRKAKLARSGSLYDHYQAIAAEWHPLRNGPLTPHGISSNSHRRVWWLCPNGHEWEQSPNHRVTLARLGRTCTCPECAKQSLGS